MNNNSNSQLGSSSISNTDLIDAKLEEHQLCGSKHCPGCGHKLDGKPDWVGLPAGVKFDPTDQELLEHLEAKVEARAEARELKSHPLIDEFIPTIDGEDGICYTHPEKLPGVARDGSNKHFFHRPSKAYTTGTRKRRKIQTECDLQSGETRWHKTGKTRPVLANGTHKGCKKILVLYTNFGKNRKPEKTNWVMHQYHLGQQEEEREGELVVSKIFYQTQPRQCTSWTDRINNSSALVIGGNEGGNISSEPNCRRDSGSGSCSSKEITTLRDEVLSSIVGVAPITNYHPVEMPQFRVQNDYNFVPFRRNFDDHQLGIIGGGEGSTARGSTSTQAATTGACQENDMMQVQQHQIMAHHHQQHHLATAANFHMNTPSHSISSILPPPLPLHHTTTSILLNEDPFHVSRMMLQNENLQQHHQQQQQQQQHDHKLGESSTSGLEELIMACTSTDIDIKEESSIPNPQEADWLKYSTFWPDPHDHNNPDRHG